MASTKRHWLLDFELQARLDCIKQINHKTVSSWHSKQIKDKYSNILPSNKNNQNTLMLIQVWDIFCVWEHVLSENIMAQHKWLTFVLYWAKYAFACLCMWMCVCLGICARQRFVERVKSSLRSFSSDQKHESNIQTRGSRPVASVQLKGWLWWCG